MRKKAIVVLGGNLVQDHGKWRTTQFLEGNPEDGLGDYLRIFAAATLVKEWQAEGDVLEVIASGGRGKLGDTLGDLTIARVLKGELVLAGVPEEVITEEIVSGSTFVQLAELVKRLDEFGEIALITNRYHISRVDAMINHAPGLEKLRAKKDQGEIVLVSAEEVCLRSDKPRWEKVVSDAYASERMKQILSNEEKGVRQITEGTYSFK